MSGPAQGAAVRPRPARLLLTGATGHAGGAALRARLRQPPGPRK